MPVETTVARVRAFSWLDENADWRTVPYHRDPANCGHLDPPGGVNEGVCPTCQPDWEEGYHFKTMTRQAHEGDRVSYDGRTGSIERIANEQITVVWDDDQTRSLLDGECQGLDLLS